MITPPVNKESPVLRSEASARSRGPLVKTTRCSNTEQTDHPLNAGVDWLEELCGLDARRSYASLLFPSLLFLLHGASWCPTHARDHRKVTWG